MKEPERPIDPPESFGLGGHNPEPVESDGLDLEAHLSAMLGNLTLQSKLLELEKDRVRGLLASMNDE